MLRVWANPVIFSINQLGLDDKIRKDLTKTLRFSVYFDRIGQKIALEISI